MERAIAGKVQYNSRRQWDSTKSRAGTGATNMEVFDAIRTLLAVRSYQDKPVADGVLRRILEAGRMSGSASNRQPWQFIVVRDRERIKEVAAAAPTGPYITQAPLVIVVAVDKSIRFSVSDGSRAIQNMMLAAWGEGVGSNWVGFAGMVEGVKAVLDIPNEFEVLGVLPFGYPSLKLGLGRKTRKPLSEIAYRERFGQPFE